MDYNALDYKENTLFGEQPRPFLLVSVLVGLVAGRFKVVRSSGKFKDGGGVDGNKGTRAGCHSNRSVYWVHFSSVAFWLNC